MDKAAKFPVDSGDSWQTDWIRFKDWWRKEAQQCWKDGRKIRAETIWEMLGEK